MKVFDIELFDDHYYIKRGAIVDTITFNHRTFYAKFERINEPLTPLLLSQHLHREYTIAAPLLRNGRTNYLVLEYKGEEHRRFYHLARHLLDTLGITDYHAYQGKDTQRIQIFIRVNALTLEEADERLRHLSDALKSKLPKKWKCLPSSALPEDYNIVTLPYTKLSDQ